MSLVAVSHPSKRSSGLSSFIRPRRVAVIGGGVAGLVVAYRRMLAGDEVTLFESSGRLGGQLWTDTKGGFTVERGAEGFTPSSDAVLELSRELGLTGRIVAQQAHRSYGFDGSRLLPLSVGEAPKRLGLRAPAGRGGRGILSFRGGMGELVDALAARIRDRVAVRLEDPIWMIRPSGSSWELATGSLARVRVDSVVLATAARVAGDLLSRVTNEPNGLERAPAWSSVTVSLAYRRASILHDLDGSGFVVDESASLEGCRACAFSSSKLPARSPDGCALLRLFFRPASSDLEGMTDAAWVDRAARVVREVLAAKGAPIQGWVDRWPGAFGVLDPDLARRVAAVERRWSSRGVLLAGSAFHAPGIDGAVRSAEAAAAALGALRKAS
jgi:oxygen-dependent protoporphyrinogen oxidase